MKTVLCLFFSLAVASPAFAGASAPALELAPASENCEAILNRFTNDPRFHWVDGFFAEIGVHRLAPNLFSNQMAALARPFMHDLPSGMTTEEHEFFNGVFTLLRDRDRVFVLLNELEQNVNRQSRMAHVSREDTLDAIFSAYEKRDGFKSIVLHDILTKEQLMAVLSKGEVFTDVIDQAPVLGIPNENGETCYPKNCHWAHGRVSHRLQMYLVLRDIEQRPDHYGNPKNILKFYKQLGSPEFNEHLDWSQTGLSSGFLFEQLFDSHENNPSSPGFFSEYREYWPDLPL